jgi:hypothetical protein
LRVSSRVAGAYRPFFSAPPVKILETSEWLRISDVQMRILLSAVLLLPLCAQPPQAGTPQAGGRGEQEPKNLKLLKPDEVRPAMRAYSTALGVRCEFCHVQGDRASDENRVKLTARNMIAMVQQINANFHGMPKVTCYTCHRGEVEPKGAPPAPAAATPAPPSGL